MSLKKWWSSWKLPTWKPESSEHYKLLFGRDAGRVWYRSIATYSMHSARVTVIHACVMPTCIIVKLLELVISYFRAPNLESHLIY